MNIKEKVKKAYKNLPEGAKKEAWQTAGWSSDYFRKIVRGEVKDLSNYYIAIEAMKTASKNELKKIREQNKIIENIKVNQPGHIK